MYSYMHAWGPRWTDYVTCCGVQLAVFVTVVDASVVVEEVEEEEEVDVCCCRSAWLEELCGASGDSVIIDPPPCPSPSARISLIVSGAEE